MGIEIAQWDLYGKALLDYLEGDKKTQIEIFYPDGDSIEFPVNIFFREEKDLPDVEQLALELCAGRVLDIGAGAGCHSLILQKRDMDVTALDVSGGACEVMRRRGVKKIIHENVFEQTPDPKYEVLLCLMNGIGFSKTLEGLANFLILARELLSGTGYILMDSSDMRDKDLESLYGENYLGETSFTFSYKGERESETPWLYVDQDTLTTVCKQQNWECNVLFKDPEGTFLAQLIPLTIS